MTVVRLRPPLRERADGHPEVSVPTDGDDPLGLSFGATSGEVFGSADAGASWSLLARDLAPVLSIRAL